MATDNGHIKLFGKFRHWGWYTDSKAVHLFVHLLLSANYEDGYFLGTHIKRGQLATSIESLSRATGLTTKEVRLRLKNFEKTGEIGKQAGNRFTVITICKYDSYQANPKEKGKPEGKRRANGGQTKGKRRATIEEDKTIRREEDKTKESVNRTHPFLQYIDKNYPQLNQMKNPMTPEEAELVRKAYMKEGIDATLNDMCNKWETVKHLESTYRTVVSWMPDKYKKPKFKL